MKATKKQLEAWQDELDACADELMNINCRIAQERRETTPDWDEIERLRDRADDIENRRQIIADTVDETGEYEVVPFNYLQWCIFARVDEQQQDIEAWQRQLDTLNEKIDDAEERESDALYWDDDAALFVARGELDELEAERNLLIDEITENGDLRVAWLDHNNALIKDNND